jgi:PadR family transcriptional regulator, regulatory protein PadR
MAQTTTPLLLPLKSQTIQLSADASRFWKTMRTGQARMSILKLLEERDMHGYQIMSELKDRSEGLISPTAGTTYPILQELESRGHVSSRWAASRGKRKRKVYHLTRKGFKTIQGVEVLKRNAEAAVDPSSVERTKISEILDTKPIKKTSLAFLTSTRHQIRKRIAFLEGRERALSRAINSFRVR